MELFDKLPLQEFWSPAAFDAKLSDGDLYKSTWEVSLGIKETKKRKLNERDIHAAEDVLDAKRKNPDSISTVKSKEVADWKNSFSCERILAKEESVQQIVCRE